MKLNELLSQRLPVSGMKKSEMAKEFGVTWAAVHQWFSKEATVPEGPRLLALFDMMGLEDVKLSDDLDVISFRETVPRAKREPTSLVEVDATSVMGREVMVSRAPEPNRNNLPKNIPVVGAVAGGRGGDFTLNGQIVDYVRRPPGLMTAIGIFALYVVSDSMSPRFETGDLVYASETRPPSVGDYVVVEMHPLTDGGERPAFIKRLKARKAGFIICEQFNPPATVRFSADRVAKLYRVIPTNEMLGV